MERLSKIISRSGVCSRRAAEKLIEEGSVVVDGKKIFEPQHHVDPEKNRISLRGKPLPKKPKSLVYLIHKPRGFVCSHVRLTPKQKLVFDLLPNHSYQLFTVGRLDKDTEGLLLITNDGFLKHKIIHPRSNIEREYIVKTKEGVTHEHLVSLGKPIYLEGKRVQARRVEKVRKNTCRIVLTDGKKHKVRHLVKRAKLTLLSLKRVRMGNLRLGSLPKGSFKILGEKELASLFPANVRLT